MFKKIKKSIKVQIYSDSKDDFSDLTKINVDIDDNNDLDEQVLDSLAQANWNSNNINNKRKRSNIINDVNIADSKTMKILPNKKTLQPFQSKDGIENTPNKNKSSNIMKEFTKDDIIKSSLSHLQPAEVKFIAPMKQSYCDSKDGRFETTRDEGSKNDKCFLSSSKSSTPIIKNKESKEYTYVYESDSEVDDDDDIVEESKEEINFKNEFINDLFSKIRHNRIEYVKQIISNDKLNPNVRDNNGNTMLHSCCQNNLKKLAILLIEFGVDVNATNKKGLTALDYCENYKFTSVGDIMSGFGAETSLELNSCNNNNE
jgi:ankyrin repeat protein